MKEIPEIPLIHGRTIPPAGHDTIACSPCPARSEKSDKQRCFQKDDVRRPNQHPTMTSKSKTIDVVRNATTRKSKIRGSRCLQNLVARTSPAAPLERTSPTRLVSPSMNKFSARSVHSTTRRFSPVGPKRRPSVENVVHHRGFVAETQEFPRPYEMHIHAVLIHC